MQDYPNVLKPDKWLNATFRLVLFFSLRMRTGCTRSTSYKVSEIKLFGIMSLLVCCRFSGNEDMYERLMRTGEILQTFKRNHSEKV